MNKKFLFIAGGIIAALIVALILMTVLGGRKPPAQITVLTFWGLNDDESAFKQTITDFEKNNPNVDIQYVKKDPATYLEDSLNEIASGRGPDIWAIPNNWLPKYQDKLVAMPDGLLYDKKAKKNDLENFQELFPKIVVKENVFQDKIFGIPISLDPLCLYYNPTIINEARQEYVKANPSAAGDSNLFSFSDSKNWDEFTKLTRIITQKSGSQISRSGVALGTADNVDGATDILSWLMLQYGTPMVSEDLSTAQFHTALNTLGGVNFPGTHALEFYASFADPKSNNYTWDESMPDSVRAFAEGKTAMMFNYLSAQNEARRINPNLSFEITTVPQVAEAAEAVNYASYLSFTVTKASKNSALAWQFITFVTSQDKANNYKTATKKPLAILSFANSSDQTVRQVITAQGWYQPDPARADEIFKEMIQQVNSGVNAQTAIEGVANQITILLQKLKGNQ